MTPHLLEVGIIVAELFEAAFGDDAALVKDIDIVEPREEVEAMDRRNDGLGGTGLEEAFVDHPLGSRVYAAGGFVEENKIAVPGGENAAGQGKPLFLAA